MEYIKTFYGNFMEYNNEINEINEHLKSGIKEVKGIKVGSEEVWFYCKDGFIVKMYHSQDCCESVMLESADSLDNDNDIYTDCEWCEMEFVHDEYKSGNSEWGTYTWTYYKFRTNKGYDVLRWYGESNGYYSEEVDFALYKQEWSDTDEI